MKWKPRIAVDIQYWIQLFNTIGWILRILNHSMARANLNKSEKLMTNNTAESKYISRRPKICINWNPPFRPHFIIDADSEPLRYVIWCCVKVSESQKHFFLKLHCSYEDRAEFCQIFRSFWGQWSLKKKKYFEIYWPLVSVTNSSLLFRLALAILWQYKLGL